MGSTPIFGMDVTGVEPGLILWQWECALKKAADRQDPFTEHVPAHTNVCIVYALPTNNLYVETVV